MPDSDLEQIIADQMAQIDQLNLKLQSNYWEGVYDRIRAAWDAWALVELGTSSPSAVDLRGRPELAALWDSVR